MARTPLNVCKEFGQDYLAKYVASEWFRLNSQRQEKRSQWQELRNYVFATDTTTTTNKSLPWKNSTTLPKLCQIRDNLHSNYISALFPNDDWLRWEAYSQNDATAQKVKAIEAYISNKCRMSNFRIEISQLLLDYIDYGNAFATVDYESSYRQAPDGSLIPDYIGPRVRRISPYDIVFNPLAASFKDTYKIVRSIKSVGEIYEKAEHEPDNAFLQNAINNRKRLLTHMANYGTEDVDKEEGFQMDGFGSYSEYLNSNYVELLQFYGDIYDDETGKLNKGIAVTVIDRMWVIQKEPLPGWLGHANIYQAQWRRRPDNLWAMGPLDNLVGMQYRIDHLENLKADAMDLAVLPPLVIQGEVEAFEWRPGAEIHIDENGAVTELAKNAQWVIQADNAIQLLEQRMEMYAGAPREAMGIRTAGEKTAFEVEQLQNAASRIFQEKISSFEIEFLEPILNTMLETARRNMDQTDVIRVMDDDLGVQEFLNVTKDDITASGVIRPIGARHFASQARLLQNLTGVFNSPIGQIILPHTSAKKLSELVEDILGLQRWDLFKPNVAIFEQQETQRLAQQAQEDLQTEMSVGTSGASQGVTQ